MATIMAIATARAWRGFCGALLLSITSMAAAETTVFELRTYTTLDGRLPALHARFRDHTMRLFEKHGMRNVGYWTPTDRPNTLVYLIAHESRESAEASWQAFIADPEWQSVYAASTKAGPILVEDGIERHFLSATAYSPLQ